MVAWKEIFKSWNRISVCLRLRSETIKWHILNLWSLLNLSIMRFDSVSCRIWTDSIPLHQSTSHSKKGGVEKTLDLSSTQMENFVASAMTFLGTPHVMGGTSRSGIDCSGLLHQSFVLNGIEGIPRTAQDFARYGIIIADINDLKRGDLVFFTGTYNSSRFVTHAGICIGQGEFVHTSSKRGVMISKLNDPNYWKSKFAFGTVLVP